MGQPHYLLKYEIHNVTKYITKLKTTIICDLELCYYRKNISKISTTRKIKKIH